MAANGNRVKVFCTWSVSCDATIEELLGEMFLSCSCRGVVSRTSLEKEVKSSIAAVESQLVQLGSCSEIRESQIGREALNADV
jgi:hypothetical protein